MYACLFTDSHVRIPFDEFTMGILRTPNVAPTQLHPNSWASLRVFHILAEMFRLKPSPYVFLHFYNSRLAWSVRWLSLISQSGVALFTSFCLSYKYFKNVFFKIIISPGGRHYFFNGDTRKFPLYWTRDSVHYLSWSRSFVTGNDKKIFDILDQFPWRLPISNILKLFLSSQR